MIQASSTGPTPARDWTSEGKLSDDISCLWLPMYERKIGGHGGFRRTLQISELMDRSNVGYFPWKTTPIKGSRVWQALQGAVAYTRINGHVPFQSGFRSYGFHTYDEKPLHSSTVRLAVIEDTRSHKLGIAWAKLFNKSVIALPQNLEAMVDAYTFGWSKQKLIQELTKEIDLLGRADLISCISREEQWLLRGFGLTSEYLPYFPPEPIAVNLRAIRKKRQETPRDNIMIFGNVGNIPNYRGMEELLSRLGDFPASVKIDICLVGYGTEHFRNHSTVKNIRVIGSVTDQELEDLFLTCRAVLIHQKFGAGGLTKIPELLVAGIPVIASEIAARSQFDYDGVYPYGSFEEMNELLTSELPMPLDPQPPIAAEQRFIEAVRRFASTSI